MQGGEGRCEVSPTCRFCTAAAHQPLPTLLGSLPDKLWDPSEVQTQFNGDFKNSLSQIILLRINVM